MELSKEKTKNKDSKPAITEPSYMNDAGTSTIDSYAATVSSIDSINFPTG